MHAFLERVAYRTCISLPYGIFRSAQRPPASCTAFPNILAAPPAVCLLPLLIAPCLTRTTTPTLLSPPSPTFLAAAINWPATCHPTTQPPNRQTTQPTTYPPAAVQDCSGRYSGNVVYDNARGAVSISPLFELDSGDLAGSNSLRGLLRRL